MELLTCNGFEDEKTMRHRGSVSHTLMHRLLFVNFEFQRRQNGVTNFPDLFQRWMKVTESGKKIIEFLLGGKSSAEMVINVAT